ncbi:hypothetical protein [Vibrio aestuarianus]|uniref:hypothetical protein n=1 Tax=Vibrio aestuarianus TaxID=28171 RepID=UPI00159442C5|nr:hypothetical protein [Vibrio aestuarianus]MDE1233937.1 hypothetical protein [Vibrio aestuarianus]MDE1244814.1 hypothetical protein [Vibrio aestuarianus]NGZ62054.1 hypothetical protein [Vibrio aestuarianus subsp. cardii]
MVGREYDARNEADYEEITLKLAVALDKIRNNPKLKASVAEIAKLAGVSRNTVASRGYGLKSKDGQLGKIGELRKERKKEAIVAKAISEANIDDCCSLEDQLDNAKAEIIFWFNKVSELQHSLDQTVIEFNRMADSKAFYEKELNKEREKNKSLQERLDMLS